ncbi:MAG: type sorting protein, partial [Segetibacter sp.]|nr:type sorting protein [Segetibacter sp.]
MKQIFIKSKRAGEAVPAGICNGFAIGICMLLSIFSAITSYAQSNITYAEYYLDQDPGLNLAMPIPITAAPNVQNVAVNLDMTTLRSGAHFFGTRARSADGVWSMNHYWILFKPYDVVLSPAPLTNITRVEYYVDTDPGIGKATSVSITPGTNLSDITFSVNPTPMVAGVHMIGSRALSANGTWSKTNFWLFYKPYGNSTPGAISNVSYVEYFIDTDPGIGKATNISVAPALNLEDVNFNVNITNTASGTHMIGARAKDAAGKWSMTNFWLFVKPYTNINANQLPNVTAVEYYLDYDPGKGKGTPVPITAGTNLADLTFNVDLTDIV